MMNTLLVQWNLNELYNNLEELQLLVELKSLPIICVQETCLLPKHNAKCKNYTLYNYDHTDGIIASRGVAILFPNDLVCSQT